MLVEKENLASLRRRWAVAAMLYAAALWLGYQWLLAAWQSGRPGQWLVIATGTMLVQMAILWWALPHNHRPTESRLLPFLGYGNCMTLTRGLLTCLLAGFLFAPRPVSALAWIPAILYTLERVIDYFDGYVARITWNETKLGAILDIEFDGLGLLIAIALGVQYGQLPPWYLLLGVSRQLFVAGLWLREQWGLPVREWPPSDHRRLIAGFQTSFISVALWPILSPDITLLASYLFALPLIYSFGRDWLVVSELVDAESRAYRVTRRVIKLVFEQWLPLAARLVGGLLAMWIVWHRAPTFQVWLEYWGSSSGTLLATLLAVGWIIAALLVLSGILGRIGALALFALAAVEIMATGLQPWTNGLLLVCAVIVIHLGSGPGILWQPEERWIRMKLGAPKEV